MSVKYYDILLPVPTEGVYTYFSEGDIAPGERAAVPLGKRYITGIVLGKREKPEFECKEIVMTYDDAPMFSDKYIAFIKAMAAYYALPAGLTLHGVISDKLMNANQGLDFQKETRAIKNIILTPIQQKTADAIDFSRYNCHLIKGVTGSGKTEIYQEAAKKAIANGKQVIYIVPEISLTPQLIERLSERLGFKPSVFHYKLNDKEREKHFTAFARGDSPFLIGARSALFVPAKNIGLIIVDEEHETSFKQEEAPSYQLRDMAVLYASILNIPVILGSATPSVESMYNASIGKYSLHEINDRHNSARLPQIKIIDMKKTDMIGNMIAEPIYDKIAETVSKNEQAIILLNRKGYTTSLYCSECGEAAVCLNCSVGIVYFKSKNKCVCRYCGAEYDRPSCASCGGVNFREWGAGTEKAAEFLNEMFPNKIIRIDTDNSSSIKTLSKQLKRFEEKEANVLVGTQLVAKGLHFPSVTFVGVLGIDSILALPDFRATERAYQLLVQVAGRAGRERLNGQVYIQTMSPHSHIFKFIEKSDNAFYRWELDRRKAIRYPPYGKLARLILSYMDRDKCRETAAAVANELKNAFSGQITVYGPIDAEIAKLKNKYRISILIKAGGNNIINNALNRAQEVFTRFKKGSMMMKIDKDPYFMM